VGAPCFSRGEPDFSPAEQRVHLQSALAAGVLFCSWPTAAICRGRAPHRKRRAAHRWVPHAPQLRVGLLKDHFPKPCQGRFQPCRRTNARRTALAAEVALLGWEPPASAGEPDFSPAEQRVHLQSALAAGFGMMIQPNSKDRSAHTNKRFGFARERLQNAKLDHS